MTHLRKMMLDELQRRSYAENTIRHYLRAVEDFARRFRSSPDRLGPRHIREYQAELFQKNDGRRHNNEMEPQGRTIASPLQTRRQSDATAISALLAYRDDPGLSKALPDR